MRTFLLVCLFVQLACADRDVKLGTKNEPPRQLEPYELYMGVIYIVQPLTPEVTSWLEELGIAYDVDASSRNPTGQDIHDVLGELTDYQAEIMGGTQDENWEAHLSGKVDDYWTSLNILKYQGLEKENELTFHKGHPELILDIVHRLSKHTGPLVLIPDTGENPAVVSSRDSLENLLAEWEHTRDIYDS